MLAETWLEHREQVVDLADGEVLDQEHGTEEDQHFPYAQEDVGEVTGIFELFLYLAQMFDET